MKPIIYEAQRFNVKASIMIESLTGGGKTGLALEMAYYLSDEKFKNVGLVDTENMSSNLYEGNILSTGIKCDPFKKIDLLESDGYAPVNYMACTDALIEAGCQTVILDSSTHSWSRKGGVLDMVNKIEADTSNNKNKYTAWGDPKVVLNKNALFEMLRNNKAHMITTVRLKEKFGMETENGKSTVKSLGEQQQMQEGAKYEVDLVLNMLEPGSKTKAPLVKIVKSRYPMFEKDHIYEMTKSTILSIKEYLEEGADPEELTQRQKQEYIDAIKEFCATNPTQKTIYDNLKKQRGLGTVKITDMSVEVIKDLHMQLTN